MEFYVTKRLGTLILGTVVEEGHFSFICIQLEKKAVTSLQIHLIALACVL